MAENFQHSSDDLALKSRNSRSFKLKGIHELDLTLTVRFLIQRKASPKIHTDLLRRWHFAPLCCLQVSQPDL